MSPYAVGRAFNRRECECVAANWSAKQSFNISLIVWLVVQYLIYAAMWKRGIVRDEKYCIYRHAVPPIQIVLQQ